MPTSQLARLKLLLAFDALLVEGSVADAAKTLGIGSPAMSRILGQLRTLFGDQIVIRSSKGLLPTPFAESMRGRLRSLAAEADDLVSARKPVAPSTAHPPRAAIVQHPPLAFRRVEQIEGQPDPRTIALRLSQIGADSEARDRLSRYLVTVGAGSGRSRPLTFEEARDAFSIVLDGEADPVQIGALLVALQSRAITAAELAGLVAAARAGCRPISARSPAALDWPAYLSPRNLQPPWFLLAARLIAFAGHRVLLHGFGRGTGSLDRSLDTLGIPYCLSLEETEAQLASGPIAFLPLVAINPQLRALSGLYRLLGMRSPINLLIQLLNPFGAPATVIGVPSASARTVHRDAAALLGWERFLAVSSHRDVAQATPVRIMKLICLDRGELSEHVVPPIQLVSTQARIAALTAPEYCAGLWTGAVRDEEATAIVIGTAALALLILDPTETSYERALAEATRLWNERA